MGLKGASGGVSQLLQKPGSHCFELEMTSHMGSNIKVTHHCLLMDDKVWSDTRTPTQISALIKEHTITPSQTGETYCTACQQTAQLLCLDVHHLHPPGVGHLLPNHCPTGDLGEKATFCPRPSSRRASLIADTPDPNDTQKTEP